MQSQISSRREIGKETWVIKIRVLRKVFSKQFCFIRCRRQHLRTVEQSRYSRFTSVENTIGNSPKVPRAKFLGSDGLICSISICKFGIFKNPFATITSLSDFYFRFRRFIILVETKKVISMNYGSCTSSWKQWRWVRLDLKLSVRDIYINSYLNPLIKFTSRSKALSLKISSHGTSLKWSCRLSQSARE